MNDGGSTADDIWTTLLQRARKDTTPHGQLDDRSLAPLRQLLEQLGNPQQRLACVHIAGSKGKSSTARYLEALLRAQGLRTGVFTSPHLEHWTERLRVEVSDYEQQLVEAYAALQQALARLDDQPAPRFFDCLTALALCLFEHCGCDWAIIETGIGGRVDATNVVTPALCIITDMELEHSDRLGSTLAAIAAEKAGIIKAQVPVVCTALPPAAFEVVAARAAAVSAPLSQLGQDFTVEPSADNTFQYAGQRSVSFGLTNPSPAQARNAALALASCETLGMEVGDQADVLTEAGLPGRCEVLRDVPLIVLDAAHTVASASELRNFLAQRTRSSSAVLVVSVSSERNLAELAGILGTMASDVIVTAADPHWSLAAATVARAFRRAYPGLDVVAVDDLEAALEQALALAGDDRTLCITGSTYLAGAARSYLRRAHPQLKSKPWSRM